jgi:hypothetical protein
VPERHSTIEKACQVQTLQLICADFHGQRK